MAPRALITESEDTNEGCQNEACMWFSQGCYIVSARVNITERLTHACASHVPTRNKLSLMHLTDGYACSGMR